MSYGFIHRLTGGASRIGGNFNVMKVSLNVAAFPPAYTIKPLFPTPTATPENGAFDPATCHAATGSIFRDHYDRWILAMYPYFVAVLSLKQNFLPFSMGSI
ncbi:hypothetical protein RND71_034218 [Anisodus tanguticus]|uniref:Uncharacterized protein n=1 Tax=Anisodus tanguticus TaxID=243964 RepID=A0AAE1R954_9SOLA|nr:hypothetical protein RND71_034218 [Anisodus tanguticus]